MATALKLTRGEKPPPVMTIAAIKEPPPSDPSRLRAEIDRRVAVARLLDPENPRKFMMQRVVALDWLRQQGVDLDALGLPIQADRDMAAAEEEAEAADDAKARGKKDVLDFPAPTPRAHRNAEAEEGVLVGVLGDNALIPELFEIVGPEDFGYPQFRAVFRAVIDLHAQGKIADAATVIQRLSGSARIDLVGGPEAVSALAARVTTRERALEHAGIVARNAELRDSLKAVAAVQKGLASGRALDADALDQIRELVNRIDRAGGDDAEAVAASPNWPNPPGDDVWHGPAAELVARIAPETEADPVSLLTQTLVAFGNVIGRNAHWVVNSTRHFCNLNAVVCGPTGQGLKGTSWNIVRRAIGGIDHTWREEAIKSGLVSGEGMIYAVRDPNPYGREPDMGVSEKRCLWVETEFTKTIGCMNRDNSILSEVICQAFDGERLSNSTKNNPCKATNAHVSVVAHTTISKIRQCLSETSKNDGFANRFLWVVSRRSKELPFGGDTDAIDLREPSRAIAEAISFAGDPAWLKRPVGMSADARDLYVAAYSGLIRARAGRAAPILDRAAPLVRRLALVYAMLDRAAEISGAHLKAALAFWEFNERCVQFLFGDTLTDPFANEILETVRAAGDDGVKQSAINARYYDRKTREVERALLDLSAAGLVEHRVVKGRGRPATIWFIPKNGGAREKREKSGASSQP